MQVERVKKECLPGSGGLDCPLLEEYDFVNDTYVVLLMTYNITGQMCPDVHYSVYTHMEYV